MKKQTRILSCVAAPLFVVLGILSCTTDDTAVAPAPIPVTITFSGSVGQSGTTRATYPDAGAGINDLESLKAKSFGVFAHHTGSTLWASYARNTPFNFMWNQQVTWDGTSSAWLYAPVKYWPNDNQPADNDGATGSVAHSNLSFLAYSPFVDPAALPATLSGSTLTGDSGHDGIIAMTANGANADEMALYYRTSIEKPFGGDESVDLLWASKLDCYKYDDGDAADDYGRVADVVPLEFKHALSRVELKVRALIDRTGEFSSDAYQFTIDDNSRMFVDTVSIVTPPYYSEGRLMIAPAAEQITWDYTGVAPGCRQTGFYLGSETATTGVYDDVAFNLRWNGKPADRATAEDAKTDFEALQSGVTSTDEQQLAASYPSYMFPPTTTQSDITIRAKYWVVTYDEKLSLNNPKYYSIVSNDITAKLGNSEFKFEPNKQYKILLNLGLTSVKFDVYVVDDIGEYILLSSVVKSWDVNTKEVNVE